MIAKECMASRDLAVSTERFVTTNHIMNRIITGGMHYVKRPKVYLSYIKVDPPANPGCRAH